MTDFQFADLIILAMVALFIGLRLRNTLGKDVGHTPDLTALRRQMTAEPEAKTTPAKAAETKEPAEDPLAALGDPLLIEGVKMIQTADASFSVDGFLEGARGAFDWVMKAYQAGDTETLQALLSPAIFEEFKSALEAMKNSTEKHETTLVKILDAQLVSAVLDKGKARVGVRFLSEQVEVTRDAEGKIIAGDPSALQTVEDNWLFEREVKSRNPNWLVMDT
jgi:predicted lipid-binding transport protein (Tim44 family)